VRGFSGTPGIRPDVVVQLTEQARPGPLSTLVEPSAGQTIESFSASLKTKINIRCENLIFTRCG